MCSRPFDRWKEIRDAALGNSKTRKAFTCGMIYANPCPASILISTSGAHCRMRPFSLKSPAAMSAFEPKILLWSWITAESSGAFITVERGKENVFVSSSVLHTTFYAAWCLVCPERELPEAIRAMAQHAPGTLVDWLTAGHVMADDGSFKRPLPKLSSKELLPLLQHKSPHIRRSAILGFSALGSSRDPMVAKSRR